ncbi:restriction endonuclease subunit S [Flavobacterium terrisoli]|uniref:restriction endonuclease subunit S n=1 Tax=Flavobacterium terrisoli TaxID=3242195 RepID=UPI0025434A37|nr:restriction endonuclease subunit S [Flavobacterium buctense]
MKNWATVKLGDLLTESKVDAITPDTRNRIRVKLNVGGIEQRPEINDKSGATKYFIRKAGQFIYGKQNLHKGAFGIVPNELDGFESSSDIPAFDVRDDCYPEWIYYFFKQNNFYSRLEVLAKGIGSKRIQPKQLFNLKIFLPTKEDQREILNKISVVEQYIDEFVTELDKQIILINKLKKTNLQEAVQGKLTNDWRLKNKSLALHDINAIQELKIEKQQKLFNVQTQINNSDQKFPFEIPSTWKWCSFNDFVKLMAYGTSQKTHDFSDQAPVLRMGNITSDGGIIYSNLKYINLNHKDLPKLYLEEGDIVFNRTNSYELVGKSAVFHRQEKKYTLASYLIKISLFDKYVNPDYINIYLNSPICRRTQIEPNIISQTNQANFSGSKLKKILVPFPPKSEQDEIVKKVDIIKNFASEFISQIERRKIDSELLLQKILNDTFGDGGNILEELSELTTIQNETGFTNKSFTIMENTKNLHQEILSRFVEKTFQFKEIEDLFATNYEESKDIFFELLNSNKIKYQYDDKIKTFKFSLI